MRCRKRHRHLVDFGADQVQLHLLAVKALDGASLELAEQFVLIFGDDVDQVLLQRFLIGP